MKTLLNVYMMLLLVAAGFFIPGSPSDAQTCGVRRVSYGPTYYSAPTYYYPSQSYYTPTVTYTAPINYNREILFYPVATAVTASPDYYYSTQSYYRDQMMVDALAYRILAVRGAAGIGGVGVGGVGIGGVGGVGAGGVGAGVGTGGLEPKRPLSAKGAARTAVTNELRTAVKDHCIKCHSGDAAKGEVALDDLETVPVGTRFECFALVNTGVMPKGATKELPDEVVTEFYNWAMSATPLAQVIKKK